MKSFLAYFHVFCFFHGLLATAELTPSMYLQMVYTTNSIAYVYLQTCVFKQTYVYIVISNNLCISVTGQEYIFRSFASRPTCHTPANALLKNQKTTQTGFCLYTAPYNMWERWASWYTINFLAWNQIARARWLRCSKENRRHAALLTIPFKIPPATDVAFNGISLYNKRVISQTDRSYAVCECERCFQLYEGNVIHIRIWNQTLKVAGQPLYLVQT